MSRYCRAVAASGVPPASENLRAEAARYHAEATEIETGVKTWELCEPPEQNRFLD